MGYSSNSLVCSFMFLLAGCMRSEETAIDYNKVSDKLINEHGFEIEAKCKDGVFECDTYSRVSLIGEALNSNYMFYIDGDQVTDIQRYYDREYTSIMNEEDEYDRYILLIHALSYSEEDINGFIVWCINEK